MKGRREWNGTEGGEGKGSDNHSGLHLPVLANELCPINLLPKFPAVYGW